MNNIFHYPKNIYISIRISFDIKTNIHIVSGILEQIYANQNQNHGKQL
jgi:hypothetical protein